MIRRSIDSLSTLLAEYLKAHPMEPGSEEQLTITVNLFTRWCLKAYGLPFNPACFSEDLVNDWLHAMREERSWVEVTANRKRRDLLTLWKFASQRDIVEHYKHGEVALFKEPEVIPDGWFLDQLGAILVGLSKVTSRRKTPGWTNLHDQAAAMIIYDTAFRIDACLALRRSDLREDGSIVARAGTQKTFTDEARWLKADTMALLRRLPVSSDGRLLPFPFGTRAFIRRWKQGLRRAGLPATRRDGPQKMRRTSVSWMEACLPGSGERHAGHKTPGLAKKRYISPLIVESVRPKSSDVLPRITGQQRKLF
jgi:integrase